MFPAGAVEMDRESEDALQLDNLKVVCVGTLIAPGSIVSLKIKETYFNKHLKLIKGKCARTWAWNLLKGSRFSGLHQG